MLGIDENSIHLPATATNVAHVNPQSAAMRAERAICKMLPQERSNDGGRAVRKILSRRGINMKQDNELTFRLPLILVLLFSLTTIHASFVTILCFFAFHIGMKQQQDKNMDKKQRN